MTHAEMFSQLLAAEIALWDSLDSTLKRNSGISLAQFHALSAIDITGDNARVQDLSDEMSITVGATSKLVDRLERDGLAERRSNPDDRRSSIVALTHQGNTALSESRAIAEDHLRSLLGATFTRARIEALTAELSALREQVSQ